MEFVEPDAAGLEDESGDEVVTDEETDLGTDWETVPSPRFCDIPSQVGRASESRECRDVMFTNQVRRVLLFSSRPWIFPRVHCRCLSPQPTPEG